MSNDEKKESINAEDIETKDVNRRKFLMGSAGTVIATAAAAAALTGCSPSDSCDADYGNTAATWDTDPYNTVATYDTDSGNACDSD
ncbi:MAG: hypothetical protein OEY29_13265 [Gammaproteobacteria bacterium]|nr:hypothetical protein [Gammaproteobacteria bacterium]